MRPTSAYVPAGTVKDDRGNVHKYGGYTVLLVECPDKHCSLIHADTPEATKAHRLLHHGGH